MPGKLFVSRAFFVLKSVKIGYNTIMMQITLKSLVNFEVNSAIHHQWPAGYSTNLPSQHYQIWLLEEGDVSVQSSEHQWALTAGQAFMMPAHYPRYIHSHQGAALLSVGYRTPSFNQGDIFSDLPLPQLWQPSAADYQTMKTWMKQIATLHRYREFNKQLTRQGLGLAILGVVWPYINQPAGEQTAADMLPDWLARSLHLMKEQPAISIEELAVTAGFSVAQYRRNFHRWMGDSPQRYLKAQRLETARLLLEISDLPLHAIAQKIGLKSGNYLSDAFKKHYGHLPSYYRNERRFPKKNGN